MTVFFARLGSTRVKAARKMLMKLTLYVSSSLIGSTNLILENETLQKAKQKKFQATKLRYKPRGNSIQGIQS